MLHFLPHEVDLHMFRQTQQRSSCRSPHYTRRCTEAAQQQRKKWCLVPAKTPQSQVPRTKLRSRRCRNQELVDFTHAVLHDRSSMAGGCTRLPADLTLVELYFQTFGLLDSLAWTNSDSTNDLTGRDWVLESWDWYPKLTAGFQLLRQLLVEGWLHWSIDW